MRGFLRKLGIRDGEAALVGRLAGLHFLLIAGYTLARTTRDAVFIDELGAVRLPWIYIAVAVWTAVVSNLVGRRAARQALHRALALAMVVSAGVLLVFLALFRHVHHPTVVVIFYLWVGANGLVLVSHLGVLLNERLDAQRIKRLIGTIVSGGILGGMCGGALATFLGPRLGPAGLLWMAAGLYVLAAPFAMSSGRDPTLENDDADSTSPEPLLRNPYVRAMAVLFLLAGLTSSLVDYQFKVVLDQHATTGEELSLFFGWYYSALNLGALLLQLFLAGPLLRRFGSAAASRLLPSGLAVGAGLAWIFPGVPLLVAGVRLYEATLRLSISRSAWEFLYFPVSAEMRRRVRTFMEATVDRTSQAVGGVLILVVTWLLGDSPLVLGGLVFGCAVCWWIANEALLRQYVQQLSVDLRHQVVPETAASESMRESHFVAEAHRLLESPFESRAVFAFEVLESLDAAGLDQRLEALLDHPVPAIRARALARLSVRPDVEPPQRQLEALLQDDSLEVRAEAIRFHCTHTHDYQAEFDRLLHSEDPVVRGAAILCAATHSPPSMERELAETLDHFLREGSAEDRRNVALALGRRAYSAPIHRRLVGLLDDPDIEVRRQAILSCGQVGLRECIPRLLELLGHRDTREPARIALARFGDRITGTLGDHLVDPTVPVTVRREIPLVLARIASQEAADQLLREPFPEDSVQLLRVLKAQNKIRKRNPGVQFPADDIRDALDREIATYLSLLFHLQAWAPQPSTRHRDLVQEGLACRRNATLNRIFRRLALLGNPEDMHLAYRAYTKSADRRTQAQALEYLEALLAPEDRRLVLAALDDQQEHRRRRIAATRFGLQPLSLQSSVENLLENGDAWMQACVLYWVGAEQAREFRACVEGVHPRRPLVEEMRRWSHARLEAA